ncbi:PIG-L deacetylase family protein [Thermodesulfobacteriota bacterium]
MTARYLVIAAHPDDEVLGCGGTVARLAREGHDVHIAILGEGVTSRYARRDQADPRLVDKLQKRSRKAGKVLGARDVLTFNLPDNRFDTVPLLDVVKIIESIIERVTPQIVFTQHGGDLNIDHTMVYRATLTAARPTTESSVKTIYAYETPSSTEWAFQKFDPSFHPNIFFDISGTLEIKLQAMQLYEGEIREFPHPRSLDALRMIARRWGSVVGLEAAEAFELVRDVR